MLILYMAGLNKVCSSPERIVPFGIAPHRVKITLGAKKKKLKIEKEKTFRWSGNLFQGKNRFFSQKGIRAYIGLNCRKP